MLWLASFATLFLATAAGSSDYIVEEELMSMEWSGYFQQSFYHAAIIPLLLVTFGLAFVSRPSTTEPIPAGFRKFQFKYLAVWTFCVAADWVQGPYVYALYHIYGFNSRQIAELFVGGFATSLACGSIVGSLCDRFGRKSCCIAYCVLYILSCITKHYNDYLVLMLGRILGGMATSMLFSCFECWLVSEHYTRYGFSSGLLSYMFGLMFTLMYGVAILSGLVAQIVADAAKFGPIYEGSMIYTGGYCAPFDVSIGCLIVGMALIAFLWEENYGEDEGANDGSAIENVKKASWLLVSNRPVLLLCAVVACFEGSMFAFVFNWTPALSSEGNPTPHGVIFALFMMSCMSGACISTLTSEWTKSTTRLAVGLVIGASCFACLAFAKIIFVPGSQTSIFSMFIAFLGFEFCCGLYFPSISELKSEIVPENVRATVYNMYRVPLNAVVICLLLTDLSLLQCFSLQALLLCVAVVSVSRIKSTVMDSDELKPLKTTSPAISGKVGQATSPASTTKSPALKAKLPEVSHECSV